MVRIISAHLSGDQIVPDSPLPPKDKVRNVSIVFEVDEELGTPRESTLSRLSGILKGSDVTIDDYYDYLEQKYR